MSVQQEVVFCTTRVWTTFNVIRGQDGSIAQSFAWDVRLSLNTISAHLQELRDGIDLLNTVPTTAKTSPIDADVFTLWDSVTAFAKGKVTRSNIKATLKTYFDGLYIALTGDQTINWVKTFSSGIISNVTWTVSWNAGTVTNGVYTTWNQTIAWVKTFSDDVVVPDEAYNATTWNWNNEVPTKNAIRDKIEAMWTWWWRTYLVLTSDFTTTSGTAVDITWLWFTPIASKVYMIEACLMTSCATWWNWVRPWIVRPTWYDHGASYMHWYSLATTTALRYTTAGANENTWAPNSPTWTAISEIRSMLVTGATPSGDFQHTVLSETWGTSVSIKRWSWIRYREIA